MKLARLVENSMDQLPEKLTWKQIAGEVGVSESALSKFRRGTELNFPALFTVARILHPENYHEIIAEWSQHVHGPTNLCFAMEYLSANRLFEAAEEKIRTMRQQDSSSKLLADLCDTYALLIERQQIQVGIPTDFIMQIDALKARTPEGRFLRQMLRVYYHSDMRHLELMRDCLSVAEEMLEHVHSADLRDLYMLRINDMKAISLLFNFNRPEESRALCEKVINSDVLDNTIYRAGAYCRMATSYMFSSYDMTAMFFRKAIAIYRATGREEVADAVEANELEFASVLWGKAKDPAELKDDSNRAFYYAKNGLSSEALEVISTLNPDSPFTRFYKGLAANDPAVLMESLILFMKGGDAFYAELPFKALQNLPQFCGVASLLRKK
ncbi:AimR family lysis-lysogeny pheromone receptor [Rossellomorea sp. RS05]|uniref:AimR family lysis-lysogeny pheromone receptor n=1 Tax=Rossellomorea sp. RS05 TaxID=3149166 RepID=UPI0032216A9C